jgi:hypothetical protein
MEFAVVADAEDVRFKRGVSMKKMKERSRRPKVSTLKSAKSPRGHAPTRKGVDGDFTWEEFPAGQERIPAIVLTEGPDDVPCAYIQFAPAKRIKSWHGTRRTCQHYQLNGANQIDYYFIDRSQFDPADLRALRRFEV